MISFIEILFCFYQDWDFSLPACLTTGAGVTTSPPTLLSPLSPSNTSLFQSNSTLTSAFVSSIWNLEVEHDRNALKAPHINQSNDGFVFARILIPENKFGVARQAGKQLRAGRKTVRAWLLHLCLNCMIAHSKGTRLPTADGPGAKHFRWSKSLKFHLLILMLFTKGSQSLSICHLDHSIAFRFHNPSVNWDWIIMIRLACILFKKPSLLHQCAHLCDWTNTGAYNSNWFHRRCFSCQQHLLPWELWWFQTNKIS